MSKKNHADYISGNLESEEKQRAIERERLIQHFIKTVGPIIRERDAHTNKHNAANNTKKDAKGETNQTDKNNIKQRFLIMDQWKRLPPREGSDQINKERLKYFSATMEKLHQSMNNSEPPKNKEKLEQYCDQYASKVIYPLITMPEESLPNPDSISRMLTRYHKDPNPSSDESSTLSNPSYNASETDYTVSSDADSTSDDESSIQSTDPWDVSYEKARLCWLLDDKVTGDATIRPPERYSSTITSLITPPPPRQSPANAEGETKPKVTSGGWTGRRIAKMVACALVGLVGIGLMATVAGAIVGVVIAKLAVHAAVKIGVNATVAKLSSIAMGVIAMRCSINGARETIKEANKTVRSETTAKACSVTLFAEKQQCAKRTTSLIQKLKQNGLEESKATSCQSNP